MKIAVGADHGGYRLKRHLIPHLRSEEHRVTDAGTFSPKPCDYPAIGAKVARAVSRGRCDRGLLLCRSGGGMAIVANRFPRVRAVVAGTIESARYAREHNDANVLVLGADYLSTEKAKRILRAWLSTPFGGGRHARRLRQVERIEKRLLGKKKQFVDRSS